MKHSTAIATLHAVSQKKISYITMFREAFHRAFLSESKQTQSTTRTVFILNQISKNSVI